VRLTEHVEWEQSNAIKDHLRRFAASVKPSAGAEPADA
jgi:hypothetical protein